MKKNFLYLLALLLLGVAVWYFVFRNSNSTISFNEKNFAVEDTASIGKIFMAGMNGQSVTLDRNDAGTWLVNNKYPARKDAMEILLTTIKNLSIKYPVPEAARNSILKNMATKNTKVEIYNLHDELIASYYVGEGTNDNNGTYMKTIEGDNPYVVTIPGFRGVLTVRYVTDAEDLRDRSIFNLPLNQISEVTTHYFGKEDSSFSLHVYGVDSFSVMNYKNRQTINPSLINKDKVGAYLILFRFTNAEAFENTNKNKDSILLQQPFCEITATDVKGNKYSALCYYKPLDQSSLQQFPNDGQPLEHDTDHYYALINSGKDFVLIQQFHFGRLFQKINFFYRKSSDRK